MPLVYVFVLFGSLLGICLVLGARVLLKHHSVRRFVRGVQQRIHSAETRGVKLVEETIIEKPRKSPRASAIELQKVRSLLRTAEKDLGQGRVDLAERSLIQALTIHPDAHDVKAQLAKLYLTNGREAKAEALYRDLVDHIQDVSFYANLGLAYYRQEKYVEACKAYQQALNRDPKNPERSAALGRACIAARHYEEAAILLEKACARLRDTDLLRMLADCYVQLNETEKALETYKRVNKIEPYDEEVKEKMMALAQA